MIEDGRKRLFVDLDGTALTLPLPLGMGSVNASGNPCIGIFRWEVL